VREIRTGVLPVLVYKDRTARTGQLEQDGKKRTTNTRELETGQRAQDSENKTERTGQLGESSKAGL
jgi:hypothetical protein